MGGNLLYYKFVVDSCLDGVLKLVLIICYHLRSHGEYTSCRRRRVSQKSGQIPAHINYILSQFLWSFNWRRYFSILIQNSDTAFLCTAKQLLRFYPQWYLGWTLMGFPSISGMFISAFQV